MGGRSGLLCGLLERWIGGDRGLSRVTQSGHRSPRLRRFGVPARLTHYAGGKGSPKPHDLVMCKIPHVLLPLRVVQHILRRPELSPILQPMNANPYPERWRRRCQDAAVEIGNPERDRMVRWKKNRQTKIRERS